MNLFKNAFVTNEKLNFENQFQTQCASFVYRRIVHYSLQLQTPCDSSKSALCDHELKDCFGH